MVLVAWNRFGLNLLRSIYSLLHATEGGLPYYYLLEPIAGYKWNTAEAAAMLRQVAAAWGEDGDGRRKCAITLLRGGALQAVPCCAEQRRFKDGCNVSLAAAWMDTPIAACEWQCLAPTRTAVGALLTEFSSLCATQLISSAWCVLV